MTYEDIVSLLGYAGGHEQVVRIMTTDRTEVVGIPMSVDTHITAHEVYLRPTGSDDTENPPYAYSSVGFVPFFCAPFFIDRNIGTLVPSFDG